jgi:hypothetical protein
MRTFIVLMCFFSVVSCSSQIYLDPSTLESAITNKEFNYNATRAFPMNSDVNNVLNSLPNTSSSRILNLDPGYGFNLKKDILSVGLPYFGRAYNAVRVMLIMEASDLNQKCLTVKQSSTKEIHNGVSHREIRRKLCFQS